MKALTSYQQRAVDFMRTHLQGLIQIPAGGGKTVTAAAALASMARDWWNPDRPMRIGWLAPTIETRDQAIAALQDFPELTHKASIRCACVSRGVDMSDRDILVVDEAKHSTAPSWRRIIEQCPNRFGLDATPFSGDRDKDQELLNIYGCLIFKVDRREVGARLVHAKVILVQASDDCAAQIDAAVERYEKKIQRQMRFSGRKLSDLEITIRAKGLAVNELGIAKNQKRNEAAVALTRQHLQADQVLVLVNYVEHGLELVKAIGPEARLVYGGLPKTVRQNIMNSVRNGTLRCLVATSLADEGLDLPSLNVLVLVSGGHSRTKAEQRTGRVLRAFGSKEHGLIYDFRDEQHPMMARHARERISVYKSLGYEITNA